MAKGHFLVFEGGEGTGKTTQIKILKQKLEEQGHLVHLTWEPGGTPLGERIRGLLLDPTTGPMSAKCEALLYAAARSEHVETVIRPKLNEGYIVLCDRYWDASRAYQGIARDLGLAGIDLVNAWGTGGLQPERVFLFDLNATVGLERAFKRTQSADRMEAEGLGFHEKVRRGYQLLVDLYPKTHQIIDASRPVEELSALLWNEVKSVFQI